MIQDVNGLKEYYNAVISLRKDSRIFFCDEVSDVEEVVDEIEKIEESIQTENLI